MVWRTSMEKPVVKIYGLAKAGAAAAHASWRMDTCSKRAE
jgi:hypothetical protein